MWMMNTSPALWVDLYELTMAQAYFQAGMTEPGYFEVFIRQLPKDWSFFVMSGLAEVQDYLQTFRFAPEDIEYLRSTALFEEDFLESLATFALNVHVRCIPEGTVFFPNEPIMEVSGPIAHAQLLETYILNILGFSIIETTLAARMTLAAGDIPILDFGMRRAQGPIASLRAARGAQIAGWKATSNVLAARELDMLPSGTMAHSFVQAHESEEEAFRIFAEIYGDKTILLVDTYDTTEGIKIAVRVAQEFQQRGVKLRGIRLDSGDIVAQSQFARRYFAEQGVEFLGIFASGNLDEFRIREVLDAGGQFDGFGVGTHYTVSKHSPSVAIVYKLAEYDDRPLHKTSADKATLPGRKTLLRSGNPKFKKDTVTPFDPDADDLLHPFASAEPIAAVQERLQQQLAALPEPIQTVRNPALYPVEFLGFSSKAKSKSP